MPRVNHLDVREILNTSLQNIDPFIQAASLLVDRVAATGAVDAATLKEIERWKAAALVARRDDAARPVFESIDGHRISYGDEPLWKTLDDVAHSLDPTGTLPKASAAGVAQFRVV